MEGTSTTQGAYAVIRQAILDKCNIGAWYDGHRREMSPHVIGLKNGREHALLYQFGGTSKSRPIGPPGSPNNWRCLDINQLSDVRTIGGAFQTAPNHSRPQSCVDVIDVEVDF